MNRAQIRRTDHVVQGIAFRRVVIDCRHATTTADVLNDQGEHDIVRLLAARHAATCQCAAYLLAAGARA